MPHALQETKSSDQAACEIQEILKSYGIATCDVLPGHDRIVVHLPLGEAQRFIDESAAVRGASSRAAYPTDPWTSSWDRTDLH